MQQTLKKWVSVLLALTLTLSLAACSSENNQSSSVSSDAASNLSSTAEDASSATDSDTSDTPTAYSKGIEDNGYFTGVTALDYVTLPDYKGIEVPAEEKEITDEELQTQLEEYLTEFNETVQVTDQAVEDGDTVNIDYVGSVDGVEFDGGNTGGSGTSVTIGVTSYIDDFLEQLIGHTPGETFDVNVTFPEDYGQDNLNGKDAVFVTTINYVEKDKYSEINDDFVSTELKDLFGWSTKAEMEEAVKSRMETSTTGTYIWNKILEQAEISEIPAAISEYQVANMTNYYTSLASQYGTTLEDLLEQQGIESVEALQEQNKDVIENNEKSSLVMQAVCEDMGIEVSDDDIKSFFANEMFVDDYSQYTAQYGLPYLRMMTRENMAMLKLGEVA